MCDFSLLHTVTETRSGETLLSCCSPLNSLRMVVSGISFFPSLSLVHTAWRRKCWEGDLRGLPREGRSCWAERRQMGAGSMLLLGRPLWTKEDKSQATIDD